MTLESGFDPNVTHTFPDNFVKNFPSFSANTNTTDFEDVTETLECLISVAWPIIADPLKILRVTYIHNFTCLKCKDKWSNDNGETHTFIPILQFLQKT